MAKPLHFRVTGVDPSGREVTLVSESVSPENARLKAQLSGVAVTRVEAVNPATGTPLRPGRFSVAIIIALVAFSLLASLGMWSRDGRAPAVEALLDGDSRALPHVVGMLLGANILNILALLFAARVARLRRAIGGNARRLVAACLLSGAAACLAILAPGGLGPRVTHAQSQRAMTDMADLLDDASGRGGRVPQVPAGATASQELYGDMAALVRIMEDAARDTAQEQMDYEVGITRLRLDSIMLAENLCSAAALEESRAKLRTAHQLLDKVERAQDDSWDTIRRRIADSPYPQGVRDLLVAEFDRGLTLTRPLVSRMLACERAVFEEVGAVVEFAAACKGRVSARGGRLVFDDDADAAAYNDSVARINAIGDLQTRVQEEALRHMREGADRFRAAAHSKGPMPQRFIPPPPASAAMRITLDPGAAAIDGWSLHLPVAPEELETRLGKPSRSFDTNGCLRVWDRLGLFTLSDSAAGPVTAVGVLLRARADIEDLPRSPFAGTLTIAGAAVTELDTPRSLNRRVTGLRFEQLEGSALWKAGLSGYDVSMMIQEEGLSDWLWIVQPDPARPSAAGSAAAPRF